MSSAFQLEAVGTVGEFLMPGLCAASIAAVLLFRLQMCLGDVYVVSAGKGVLFRAAAALQQVQRSALLALLVAALA
ncbi:hypothetical protein [Streptomyces sp. CA-106131]|uniref:hypothetical protein n=1 Tax=Streptomyces sp. CA-106131 TaxID=3240045 RepID=UPI003D8ADD32